jgi:hypothetical protein
MENLSYLYELILILFYYFECLQTKNPPGGDTFFGSEAPCASPLPRPSIFSDYSFRSTTLLTGMTGISLHMQCAMASDFSAPGGDT